jgi:hypothetical protein
MSYIEGNRVSLSLLGLFLCLLSACSSIVSVTEHHKATFDKNSTVTVIAENSNLLRLKFELEHQLLARGYNIVSEDVALRKAKLDVNIDYNDNKERRGYESYQLRQLMSVYSLKLYGKLPIVYGALIDLRTGQVIKSIKLESFSDSMSRLVDSLINRMEIPRLATEQRGWSESELKIAGVFAGGFLILIIILKIFN